MKRIVGKVTDVLLLDWQFIGAPVYTEYIRFGM